MNTRTAMPPPTIKHKPSGRKPLVTIYEEPDRPLTFSVPEPAFKQRKTLAEQAGEPIRKLAAPPTARPVTNGVKSAIGRGLAASTSRMNSKVNSRQPSASALSGSVGAGPRTATGNVRPKSAYGQYNGHARSKSYQQPPRPGTAARQREEDDDSDEVERKGVQPFHISTNPSESLRALKKPAAASKKRPNSLSVVGPKRLHTSTTRTVSSPACIRSTTPVIEEPANDDCEEICAGVEALTLRKARLEIRDNRAGCGMTSDKEENPFLSPKKSQSQLPVPTPTPVRQQIMDLTPYWSMSTTPRKPAPAPFLNRFTNDRCPDFYNERMEAMERDFRMFKEKMEVDVRQATDYKESIQQLQSRGTALLTVLEHFKVP
jgi:kinesin family protein C1